MNNIKKFIERVSHMDSTGAASLFLSASDARVLRDELSKLLVDFVNSHEKNNNLTTRSDSNERVIRGGSW
jgi:hypothetical protein